MICPNSCHAGGLQAIFIHSFPKKYMCFLFNAQVGNYFSSIAYMYGTLPELGHSKMPGHRFATCNILLVLLVMHIKKKGQTLANIKGKTHSPDVISQHH
jgi:hypothetical protein